MKLARNSLPPIPSTTMDRLPLPLPFSADLLWRYPLGFPSIPQPQQPPASPLMDYKSQLPNNLASDPRVWSRDDVITFLRWAEREYDIQPIDMDMFQMNGKAMCLLTRTDFSERSPSSGDVLHNALQLLIREANALQRCLPSSPITPTSRHAYPLSPHSHPPTPTWNLIPQNSSDAFHPAQAASLAVHLMAQGNSVTLSPAPSIDSQAGSPQHAEVNHQSFGYTFFSSGSASNGSGSNQSDSEEDGYLDVKSAPNNTSPPNTPSYVIPPPLPYNCASPKEVSSPVFKREFFPTETPEPNTSGRLLWDFLQQLLNDSSQRYTTLIAWKNRDTGVFKIVDPTGLAKLWGIQKNHLSMNYDKMSRALRYYYRVNILRKVQGERHCYQFLRNPTELKSIKNISLLRQQMSPTRPTPTPAVLTHVKIEPEIDHALGRNQEFEEKPTDLSMGVPTDLSSNSSRHVMCVPDNTQIVKEDSQRLQQYYIKESEK